MFQHIIYFSSNDIDQNSIFLNHQFLERLINYYLFELNISSVFIICHNIITDSNFSLDLLNIIIESNYIPFFLKNFQSNEHFLTMLNTLIYKIHILKPKELIIFNDTIPAMINTIISNFFKDQLLRIDSLCNLSSTPGCLNAALKYGLLDAFQKTLPYSKILTFCKILFLFLQIHEIDSSFKLPNDTILSLLLYHFEISEDKEAIIMIDYLRYLINDDTQFFFESDIINELLSITLKCSFKKKKEIVYFFAQSLPIIFQNCSQFLHQICIETVGIKFQNATIHNIISLIMETCMSFDDNKIDTCLKAIEFYFSQNLNDAYSAADETNFSNILFEIVNNNTRPIFTINFAQFLLSSFFNETVSNENEI